MKFGKYIRTVAYPSWADQYVDYKLLKKFLKPFEDGVATQVHEDGFLACLQAEINKVLARAFFLDVCKDILLLLPMGVCLCSSIAASTRHYDFCSDLIVCREWGQVDAFFNEKEAEFLQLQLEYAVKVRYCSPTNCAQIARARARVHTHIIDKHRSVSTLVLVTNMHTRITHASHTHTRTHAARK